MCSRRQICLGKRQCRLRDLEFADSTIWVARAPLSLDSNSKNVGKLSVLESEIATIAFVKQHSSIPVPEIFGYNLDENNDFGAPCIYMEALPGRTLHLLPLIDDTPKTHVYRQVAQVML
jgi:hypothetical protein